MNPLDIVLVGICGKVIAFERATGRRAWEAELPGSGIGGRFVSLASDEKRVFAHTNGELFCLDLATGSLLWKDGLSGLGYGVASVLAPGQATTPTTTLVRHLEESARANP